MEVFVASRSASEMSTCNSWNYIQLHTSSAPAEAHSKKQNKPILMNAAITDLNIYPLIPAASRSVLLGILLLFCDLPFVRVSLSLPLPSFLFSSSRTVSLSNTHSFFKIRKLEVKPVVSSRPQIWLHPFEFLQKVVIIFLIVCYLSCFFFVFLCNCCLVVSNPCCVFVFSFMSVLLSGAASVPECTLNGSVKRV